MTLQGAVLLETAAAAAEHHLSKGIQSRSEVNPGGRDG